MLLGYNDLELANKGGYDLVHYDDLAYVASAHQECKLSWRVYTDRLHKVYTMVKGELFYEFGSIFSANTRRIIVLFYGWDVQLRNMHKKENVTKNMREY